MNKENLASFTHDLNVRVFFGELFILRKMQGKKAKKMH